MNNILILGASGYAGRAVLNQLSKSYSVYGTCYGQKDKWKSNDKMLFFDIGDRNGLNGILERTRPQIIVSSLRGDFEEQKIVHWEAAEYIARQPNGKLIYLSTANVFDNRPETPHYEQDETGARSDYGKFKIDCERMLQSRLNEKSIILRVPQIWGRDCPRLRKLAADIKSHGKIISWENIYVNYTLDIQIAQYIQYIIEHNLTGIFHIGSRDLYDYTRFQKDLAARLSLGSPDFDIQTLPQKEYQAVLTSRNDIPEELSLSVGDIMEYLAKQT